MKQKKIAYYIHAACIAVVAIFGITSFMMYYDIIGRSLQSVLHLKINPSFIGGTVAAVFYDPVGDDHGYGNLAQPVHKDFVPGSLDLVRYTVHEPVYNAQWSNLTDYWQLDLAFGGSSDSFRNIRIYIDADCDANGSTETKDAFAEGVEFDSLSPWDYVLSVHDRQGTLESCDKTISVPLVVMPSHSKKELTVRIPLANRVLQSLYEASETRHYILVGAWSPWGEDGFAEVQEQKEASGLTVSSFTPKIYDILTIDGISQEELLSAWDDDSLTIPVVYPVVVAMHKNSNTTSGVMVGASKKNLAELEDAAAKETAAEKRASLALFDVPPADETEYAIAAFNAGKSIEAEKAFDAILKKNPDSAIAVAYKGSLIAQKASDVSPLAAVDLVANAYGYLDRAVTLASDPVSRITAYLNRAYVSKSVPDLVFGKALQGAEDFLAATEEMKKIGVSRAVGEAGDLAADLAGGYCNAALCYEIAGKKDEAETWFREAARVIMTAAPGSGANVRLILFRHFELGL